MSEITWEEAWDAFKGTEKSFSGSSWGGFWLLGDAKSIREVARLQACEARMKALEIEIQTRVNARASDRVRELERMVANLQSAAHQL